MTQKSDLSGNIPRYIAIEGPIGVGKTSLTKRLAESFKRTQSRLEEMRTHDYLAKEHLP